MKKTKLSIAISMMLLASSWGVVAQDLLQPEPVNIDGGGSLPPPPDGSDDLPPPPSDGDDDLPPPPSEGDDDLPPPPSDGDNDLHPPPSDGDDDLPPPPAGSDDLPSPSDGGGGPPGLGGMNLGQMNGLEIQKMDPEQLRGFSDAELEEMDEDDRSKLLGNMPPEMAPEDIDRFLPEGWQRGDDNSLQRPPGGRIDMPPADLPEHVDVTLPELPDMMQGFGVGGAIGEGEMSAQNGIDQLLQPFGFSSRQQNGMLNVEGPQGFQMAFMPEGDSMQQGPEGVEPGISLGEHGEFVLTLQGGAQIPVRGAPKDPLQAQEALPGGGSLEMDSNGRVDMEMQDPPEGVPPKISVRFDPTVMPTEDAEPGIHPTDDGGYMMVYEDGSGQKLNPAVNRPDEFNQVGGEFPGVGGIQHNEDGSVDVDLDGTPPLRLKLRPDYEVKPGAPGAGDTPMITVNEDGTLSFVDSEGNIQILTIEEVMPRPDNGGDAPDDV